MTRPEGQSGFVRPKPREPRSPVLLNALLRGGGQERIVRIRNVSSRGMLIETNEAPNVGVTVEVSVGRVSVLGRIVWRKDKQLGFHSRNTIDKDGLAKGHRAAKEARRSDPSPSPSPGTDRAAHYRLVSRATQFVAGIAFALGGCTVIAILLHEMLLKPVQALSTHLSP
ncbi:hypothetical protein GRI75_07540 [Altererythrobacter soli]|uniref:PilZ domain-containing protein n=1 Tax=Croceibacterium soli TaxID=1739690 RepID=A0A6I4UWY2_9SPHN|nr:PilZ domain-containing protein [Croceibacterium soli]MXP41495.1 hypothetical protein [Croceibacterium soli]